MCHLRLCAVADSTLGLASELSPRWRVLVMIEVVLRFIFRCSHRSMSRPITPVNRSSVAGRGTYVVCLDCGTQFPYDWEQMRMGRPDRRSPAVDAWQHSAN